MTSKKQLPYKIEEALLETLLFRAVEFGAMSDYEEKFRRIAEKKGAAAAHLWYIMHIFMAFPPFIYQTSYWGMVMFRNYFIVALRNLKKQKAYALINIFGLAFGMAFFALFALSAAVKLNAEKFHDNAERIYGVVQVVQTGNEDEEHTAFIPAPMLTALQNEIPDIEDAVRVLPAGRMTFKRQGDSFYERDILFVDPNFLTFFTFKMMAGNPETALAEPYSIVMSEAAAEKYFGEDDPIGKTLTLEGKIDITVTGVVSNIGRTSSIHFDYLISMDTARALGEEPDSWDTRRHAGFVLLSKNIDKKMIEAGFPAFINKHYEDPPQSPKQMYLFPLLDFRLDGSHIKTFLSTTVREGTYIILAIGTLLLLVVCINFVNLTTARHMYRAKEIGLRKVIGARRSQLVKQFLGESIFLSMLAVPVAVILYEIIHPVFAAYMGDLASFTFVTKVSNSIWNYPFLLNYILIAALLTGLFSGLYPALFLSSFKPVQVLKGSTHSGKKKGFGRKIMIVFQFMLSILFILLAGVLSEQFDYLLKADLGYSRDRIAVLPLSNEARSNLDLMRTEFSRMADVTSVSTSADLPGIWTSPRPAILEGRSDENAITVEAFGIDYDFVEALDMQVTRGRSFSRDHADDSNFIINETTVELLQLANPVGRQLTVGEQTGTVIGVVEDFLFGDIAFSIPPAVLYIENTDMNYMLLKLASENNFPAFKEQLKDKWLVMAPDTPFNCMLFRDYFYDFFKMLESIAGFIKIVGFSAMFFTCLGLLGLASYMIERRTKEIGIRKVLGASIPGVIWILIKEFILLVVIANVIILPLVYIGWQRILRFGLLYITDIGTGTFTFAIGISLFTAMLAVVSRTLRAARSNPVDSLRYE